MNRNMFIGYLVTISAGLSFGAIPVFSGLLRNAGVSIVEIALMRLILGTLTALSVIFAYSIINRNSVIISLDGMVQFSYIIQGFIFALALIVYIISISIGVAAGEAALLIQIHPIITLIFGFIFLGEKITRNKIISVLLAFFGLIIITHPWDWQSFSSSLIGDLFALSNGLLYSIYLILGVWGHKFRKNIASTISVAWILFWALITSLPLLFILTLLPVPESLVSFDLLKFISPNLLLLAILLTLFGSILPYGLIMISNSFEIESSRQSILLLGEPIGAIILGALLLNEKPTIWYLIGGIPLLSAIIVITLSIKNQTEKINQKPTIPDPKKVLS